MEYQVWELWRLRTCWFGCWCTCRHRCICPCRFSTLTHACSIASCWFKTCLLYFNLVIFVFVIILPFLVCCKIDALLLLNHLIIKFTLYTIMLIIILYFYILIFIRIKKLYNDRITIVNIHMNLHMYNHWGFGDLFF